jgi:hypothetical protein
LFPAVKDVLIWLLAGAAGAFLNTVAFSGSAIVVPILIAIGLAPIVTNASNPEDQRRTLGLTKTESVCSRPPYLGVIWPLGPTTHAMLRLLQCHNVMQIVASVLSGHSRSIDSHEEVLFFE